MDKVEKSRRDNLIKFLESELGVSEYPAGSNRVKYNDWYYERGTDYHRNSTPYAWCGTFCAYALHFSGIYIDTDMFNALMYVPKAKNVLTARKKKTDTPRPGDLVIFDWNNDGFTEHIGFYIGMDGNRVLTIEGNTSSDIAGDQSNGGKVCKKRRHQKQIQGFYSPF